jgi:hypothetical protein
MKPDPVMALALELHSDFEQTLNSALFTTNT